MNEEENNVGETSVEETTETTNNESTEQTGTELSAETLLVQKNKINDKYKTLLTEHEALKAKAPLVKEQTKDEVVSNNNDRLAAVEFKIANPSLDADVINNVFKLAKAEGKTPKEMLDDPMVKAFIEKKNRDANNQAAMPNGGGKHFIKTSKPIKEMDEEMFKNEVWSKNRLKK